MSKTPPRDDDSETPEKAPALPPLIRSSDEILQGRREVLIEHGGEMYRLRITSKGRLILTK